MAQQKLLGKWTSTSLVVGNMVGAGVFMMPALLAAYGGISIVGWLVSSAGAILLAVLFSRLSKLLPGLQGGPYAYTQKGMGDFPAFLVAWGYWISVWTTNAALAVAFVGYLSVLIPILAVKTIYSIGMALFAIWFLTWFNTRSIKNVGTMSLITTILKLAPLILISAMGLFFINPDYFTPFNLSSETNLSAIAITTALTFFSFLGIESATIPAENVINPEKTVPFATKWGTLIASIVYILSSVSIMGIINPESLSLSTAPFADAATILWGEGADYVIAIAAVISVFGALNGWILIQGQMPEAIAQNGFFPAVFAKKNKHGMPALGIIISSMLATFLIVMNYSGGLLKVFEFMILVSTVSVLIPYLFCSVSYVLLKKKSGNDLLKNSSILLISSLTFLFSLFALIGSGFESVFWGVLFLLMGIPVYLFIKRKKSVL
ncbi:MAG: amino acid permease [Balneolaceae bacterium]